MVVSRRISQTHLVASRSLSREVLEDPLNLVLRVAHNDAEIREKSTVVGEDVARRRI